MTKKQRDEITPEMIKNALNSWHVELGNTTSVSFRAVNRSTGKSQPWRDTYEEAVKDIPTQRDNP